MLRLTDQQFAALLHTLGELQRDAQVRSMRQYVQHGATSTYRHCLRVAALSYAFAQLLCRLRIAVDQHSLLRGAMLHDFYLYDWHIRSRTHRLHGFFHAERALQNAEHRFQLTDTERDIIRSHMWPLNLTRPPHTREGAIVCLADKLCSIGEL